MYKCISVANGIQKIWSSFVITSPNFPSYNSSDFNCRTNRPHRITHLTPPHRKKLKHANSVTKSINIPPPPLQHFSNPPFPNFPTRVKFKFRGLDYGRFRARIFRGYVPQNSLAFRGHAIASAAVSHVAAPKPPSTDFVLTTRRGNSCSAQFATKVEKFAGDASRNRSTDVDHVAQCRVGKMGAVGGIPTPRSRCTSGTASLTFLHLLHHFSCFMYRA